MKNEFIYHSLNKERQVVNFKKITGSQSYWLALKINRLK